MSGYILFLYGLFKTAEIIPAISFPPITSVDTTRLIRTTTKIPDSNYKLLNWDCKPVPDTPEGPRCV